MILNLLPILLELVCYLFYYLFSLVGICEMPSSHKNKERSDENRIKREKVRSISTSQSLIKDNSKISVIIPSYNEEKHLNKAISSALSDSNIEIVVSDGGSTDLTSTMMTDYCSKYTNINFISG